MAFDKKDWKDWKYYQERVFLVISTSFSLQYLLLKATCYEIGEPTNDFELSSLADVNCGKNYLPVYGVVFNAIYEYIRHCKQMFCVNVWCVNAL